MAVESKYDPKDMVRLAMIPTFDLPHFAHWLFRSSATLDLLD